MEESHAFICETCHAGFRTKQALGSHRRWKHPIRVVRKILPSNPFFSFFKNAAIVLVWILSASGGWQKDFFSKLIFKKNLSAKRTNWKNSQLNMRKSFSRFESESLRVMKVNGHFRLIFCFFFLTEILSLVRVLRAGANPSPSGGSTVFDGTWRQNCSHSKGCVK